MLTKTMTMTVRLCSMIFPLFIDSQVSTVQLQFLYITTVSPSLLVESVDKDCKYKCYIYYIYIIYIINDTDMHHHIPSTHMLLVYIIQPDPVRLWSIYHNFLHIYNITQDSSLLLSLCCS